MTVIKMKRLTYTIVVQDRVQYEEILITNLLHTDGKNVLLLTLQQRAGI
jgi:hypothetical protein